MSDGPDVHNNVFKGDMVLRDKIVLLHLTNLETALENVSKLQNGNVSGDQFNMLQPSDDPLIGVEEKLKNGDRHDLLEDAMLLKLRFEKHITKHQLSGVLMMIYVHVLEYIITVFRLKVRPLILDSKPKSEVDDAIFTFVVSELHRVLTKYDPAATTQQIMGMVFSLTGACHLRWDK